MRLIETGIYNPVLSVGAVSAVVLGRIFYTVSCPNEQQMKPS